MNKITLIHYLFVMLMLCFLFPSCNKDEEETKDTNQGTIQDAEGNTYKTIKMGIQWWMAENLKTTKFSTGDNILNVTSAAEWVGLDNAAFCNLKNDTAFTDDYGRLYNWHAVVHGRKICPAGWHVPNDDEWTTLVEFLGGADAAGGKLKQTGTEFWNSPNTGATNESGFTAVPAGVRSGSNGNFEGLGINASWWSTTQQNDDKAFVWGVNSVNGAVSHYGMVKKAGLSIRCIKN